MNYRADHILRRIPAAEVPRYPIQYIVTSTRSGMHGSTTKTYALPWSGTSPAPGEPSAADTLSAIRKNARKRKMERKRKQAGRNAQASLWKNRTRQKTS